MDADRVKKLLMVAIKWLKIILAILMFVLGMLGESVRLDPSATPQELEDAKDSIGLSAFGLVVNAMFGCPCMLALGHWASSFIPYFEHLPFNC